MNYDEREQKEIINALIFPEEVATRTPRSPLGRD